VIEIPKSVDTLMSKSSGLK